MDNEQLYNAFVKSLIHIYNNLNAGTEQAYYVNIGFALAVLAAHPGLDSSTYNDKVNELNNLLIAFSEKLALPDKEIH